MSIQIPKENIKFICGWKHDRFPNNALLIKVNHSYDQYGYIVLTLDYGQYQGTYFNEASGLYCLGEFVPNAAWYTTERKTTESVIPLDGLKPLWNNVVNNVPPDFVYDQNKEKSNMSCVVISEIRKAANNETIKQGESNMFNLFKSGVVDGLKQGATDEVGEVLLDIFKSVVGDNALLSTDKGREIAKVLSGYGILFALDACGLSAENKATVAECVKLQTQTGTMRLLQPHMGKITNAVTSLVTKFGKKAAE